MATRKIALVVQGMTYAGCVEKIQTILSRVDGVLSARVNLATERATIVYDPAATNAAKIVGVLQTNGFDVLLERAVFRLRDLLRSPEMTAVPPEALVDARINGRTRRVEIAWLPGTANGSASHLSRGFVLGLMIHWLGDAFRRRASTVL